MNVMIAIGAAQSFFLAMLVWLRKPRALPEILLSVLLSLTGTLFLFAFLSFELEEPDLLLPLVNAGLLLAPIFHIYGRSLRQPHGLRRRDLWHFLVYALTWLYLIALILINEHALDLYFAEPDPFKRPLLFNMMLLAEIISIPAYTGLILQGLTGWRRELSNSHANHDGIDLSWLRVLAWVLLVMWLLLTIPDALGLHLGFSPVSIKLGFVLATPPIFFLGFFGLRQTEVFLSQKVIERPLSEPPATTPYKKAELPADEIEQKLKDLHEVMTKEKPWLNPRFTLAELAEITGMTTHNLSQLINSHLDANFYDYINRFRIEAFKQHIKEGDAQRFTLLAIALECGFNAKSSFNRIFKKQTGQTPSQYVKSID